MRLLLTRPEPDASRSAAILRALGHEVVLAPLMQVRTIEAQFGGPFAAVLMTSANAARAAAAHSDFAEFKRWPALTVGDRSAEAAREVGFAEVVSAGGALGDLVALTAARFPGTRLLYLAGENRAGDLGRDLAAHGIAVETVVIYRAVAATALPREAAQAFGAGMLDAALHYSRRSAATLIRLASDAGAVNALLGLAHYCLSEEVAGPLRDAGVGRIIVAPEPTEAALFAML
jgi:uroporphyrinogen-III synthase